MKNKFIVIFLSVVAVFALFGSSIGIGDAIVDGINAKTSLSFKVDGEIGQNAPEYVDGHVCFTTDTELKVMQLTDVHICGGLLSYKKDLMALNAVATLIATEKPDLVVVTGDISYGTPPSLNLNNMVVIKMFAEMMENLGVYWTAALGNHDSEFYDLYARPQVGAYLESDALPHCLFTSGSPEVHGVGNHVITVRNSLGLYTQAIVMFDSGDYQSGYVYDYIHDSQVDWYEAEITALNAANVATLKKLDGTELPYSAETYKTVKSMAFFHIPLEEYRYAAAQYTENDHQSTDEVTYIYGEVNEPVCNSPTESNIFEKMVELDSTKGIFAGHDHTNNFCLEYKGIKLAYSYSIDYYAYDDIDKKGNYRGCTMITVSPDGSFTSKLENYYQEKYVSFLPKESVYFE